LRKVPPLLQVEPEPGRRAEQSRQSQSRVRRHRTPPVDDLIYALKRNADSACQLHLGHAEWVHELTGEHVAGMRGKAILWEAKHAIPVALVVVHDLNVRRTDCGPRKADPVLLVDPNTVLALPVAL
jgi:hypothetical protein